MSDDNTTPKPSPPEEPADRGLDGAACSPSSLRDRFSWSRVKPTERAIPETMEEVVLLLESRMEVHQDWLDWFRSGDEAEVQEAMNAGVGTIEPHEYYIAQYRAAIKIIRLVRQENSIRITDALCVLDDLEHSRTVCGGFPKMCLRKIREILTENVKRTRHEPKPIMNTNKTLPPEVLGSPSGYASLPVSGIIDRVLELLYNCPKNSDCRNRLARIKDGIFLELPETRTALLCQVGRVINEHVPSGKTNDQRDEYWLEIRELLTAAFSPHNDQVVAPPPQMPDSK